MTYFQLDAAYSDTYLFWVDGTRDQKILGRMACYTPTVEKSLFLSSRMVSCGIST